MWKWLRNSIFVAIVVAGALKLVLWYEIQQGGARLAAQLGPVAQLQYTGIGASLAGNVELTGVTLAFAKDPAHATWRAASVGLTTPGPLWLARRLLLGDDSLPEHLIATVSGLQPPATAFAPLAGWLSPLSLVPFETQGCGVVTRFSVADYQRMGINPGLQQQRLEYHYDPATAQLSAVADLRAPPFSTITVHVELQRFTPQQLAAWDWRALHAGEISVGYVDTGYLARRNRFCAQQAGIDAAQFVDQHVAAVQNLLAKRGVEPSAQVTALYRSMMHEGGRIGVLSLPAAAATLGQILADSPDAAVRRLNLTARRNETPPVMVRLAFRTPDAGAPADVETVTAAASGVAAPPAAPVPPVPSATAGPAVASAPARPLAPIARPAPLPTLPSPHAAETGAPAIVSRPTAALPAGKPAPKSAAGPPLVVRSPTAKPDAAVAAAHASQSTDVLPSAPVPPPDSTLALVWKPTLDRIGAAPAAPRDYDVVDYAALGGYAGRTVRLLTTTGKKVDGRVVRVDATSVAVRIQRAGGSAELEVPRNVISEIRIPRARAPSDHG